MKTLRTRIITGYVVIIVVLITGGIITAKTQRDHLFGAVDARIARVIDSPRFIEKRIESGRPGKPAGAGLSDMYLGLVAHDAGGLSTLSAPDDDPAFEPDVSKLQTDEKPRTVRTEAGIGTRARAAMAELPDGATAVVAISLASTDRSISRLNTTLLLVMLGVLLAITLLTAWILLLGIKPIRALTMAAGKVAEGESPDVSSVPTASREATDLKTAINALIAHAKDNEDKMRRFVADASHELRTPLTTLRGYASLLSSGNANEPGLLNDSLQRISEESLRMSRLVDDLLALTRSDDAGGIDVSRFDLAALVHDISADLRVVQPDRIINVSTPDHLDIDADRALIAQALLALTTNALRHTPSSASVSIVIRDHDESVRFEVTDTGQGIEPAHLPFLFDRFYRVSSSGSQAGSGLGLAIVASIIERHAGTLGVESTPGQGSTFWFEIPLAAAND